MKKIISVLLISFLCSFFVMAQALRAPLNQTGSKVENHSFLSDEHVGSKITITGLLSASKNTFVLKENPDSKSVVTFNLKVTKWGLKRKLRKLDGQTVTLTGTLTDAPSPWSKKLKVLKIN